MSGRSILRLTLAGLLAAALAAPAAAQEGGVRPGRRMAVPAQIQQAVPEAPMPREKADDVTIEIELSLGGLRVKVQEAPTGSFGAGLAEAATPVMPQPTPPVVATPDNRQFFNFSVGLFDSDVPVMPQPAAPGCLAGGHGSRPAVAPAFTVSPLPCCPPAALTPIAPPPAPAGRTHNAGVIRVIAVDACPPCPFPQVAPNPLIGTWYRDLGVGVIAVTFTHDEMKVTARQCEDGGVVTLTLTAHYTITKDGLVYGAVTGADVDMKADGKGEAAADMELAELSLTLQELADGPFSFRAKMTSAGLMISQVKVASVEGLRGKEFAVFGGLYKSSKDGKVPAPTPTKRESGPKASYAAPPALPLDTPLPPPPPRYTATVGPDGLQRVGVDFQYNAPQMLPPVPCDRGVGAAVGSAACPLPAPRPVCNDAMKSMAADLFGQMLRGATLPSPRYLDGHFPQYFPPDPAFPLPRELNSQEVPIAAPPIVQGTVPAGTPTGSYVVLPAGAAPMPFKNVGVGAGPVRASHTGTWFREVGSKHCVVKIEADHLTVTLSESQELDGKTMTGHLTFTADYSVTRDGMTAVGLITSVDVKCDGDLPEEDVHEMMEQVRAMQKALEEKPFAMTFRRYGETLVIGNVRMPEVNDGMASPPATYVGGRYKEVGDKPLPKLKVTKACEPRPMPMPFGPASLNQPYGMGVYGPPGPPPPGAYNFPPAPVGPGVYGPPPPVPCPGPYGLPPGAFNGPALPPTYPGPSSVAIPFAPGSGCPQAGLPPIPGPVPAPIPAGGGDLLPPQSLPTPTRPAEFVTPAVRPTRPAEAPAEPTMSEPTAPVPTMPEPIPPAISACEPKPVVGVNWTQEVTFLPDPTRNGAPGAGLSGKLLLPAGSKGTLTVDLVDATPPTTGRRAVTSERWQFDKATLARLATEEPNGLCHAIFLPWSGYKADVGRVRLTVRFDSEDGNTLLLPASVVELATPSQEPPATGQGLPVMRKGSSLHELQAYDPNWNVFNFGERVFPSQ